MFLKLMTASSHMVHQNHLLILGHCVHHNNQELRLERVDFR
jgi:hypothetical protein